MSQYNLKPEDITLDLLYDLRMIMGFDMIQEVYDDLETDEMRDLFIAKNQEYIEKEYWKVRNPEGNGW